MYTFNLFLNNFYTFLFLDLTSMGENEDIEENDSDSDGEVMNTASDLMCSTPPVASPMTPSTSSFLSTSTQRMRTPMRGHGRPVRGKNQSRGRGREFCRGGGVDVVGEGGGEVVGGGGGEVVGEAGGDVVEGGGEDVVKEVGGGGEGEDVVEGRGGDVVEGGDMAVGECKVEEVMELVELPQVLVEV